MSKENSQPETSKWVPPFQRADSITLDGCHYLLSKYNNKWAVLHDGDWAIIPEEKYIFVYMGRDTNGRNSKWKVIRKQGTLKFTSRNDEEAELNTETSDGLRDFKVVANINKHKDTLHLRAHDARHAEMLAFCELSMRIKLSVATLRSMCLPDSLNIQLQPED